MSQLFDAVVGTPADGQLLAYNGLLRKWMPVVSLPSGSPSMLQKAGIDATVLAATVIGATENNGRRFYPTAVLFEALAVAALISVALVSVGTNGTTYNDIMPASALTGLTSINGTFRFPVASSSSFAPGTSISAKVTLGAVATTYTLRAVVEGYYI